MAEEEREREEEQKQEKNEAKIKGFGKFVKKETILKRDLRNRAKSGKKPDSSVGREREYDEDRIREEEEEREMERK